jgi:hypothetical protein
LEIDKIRKDKNMVTHCLTPEILDCSKDEICNKIGYEHCMKCKNNKVVIKNKEIENKKIFLRRFNNDN